jgi:hypothetical protein
MKPRSIVAAALLFSAVSVAAGQALYRIEFAGKGVLWSREAPRTQKGQLLFRRHPDGILMTVKKSDVARVVAVTFEEPPSAALRPGEQKDIGVTARVMASAGTAPTAGGAQPLRPGETPEGKAVLNPDRDYRPGWDSTRVPGSSEPFPASRGDYREGRSFAYPPGTATQASPGDVPKGVPTGEPPKMPE